MKKHLFILIFALPIFIGQGVSGQGYVPLVDTNKVWSNWSNISYFWGPPTCYIKIGGDTIIESTQYKKMYFSFDSLQITWYPSAMGIREEDKRIYLKFDSDERMLYDFNIEVGDTFFTTIIHYPHCQMVVSSMDSVELENHEFRRRIVFSYESNTPNEQCDLSIYDVPNEEWIEGIGSKRGLLPFFLYFGSMPPGNEFLLCFHENDTLKHINSYIPVCYLASNTQEYDKSQNIKFYPNPCSDIVNIELHSFYDNEVRFNMFNINGQLVKSEIIKNKGVGIFSINVSDLPKGIYILNIQSETKQFNKKVIIY